MMDIKKIISDYHEASEEKKVQIQNQIKKEFALLSEDEKKEVQRVFLECQDAVIKEGRELIAELKLQTELKRVSKYVSMSYIAKNYFGKSRQWLNNRIKGNLVNGKPAGFTSDELNQFSTALVNLSNEIKDTAFRISH